MSQKKGIIFSLMDRVLLLSDPVFHSKNITLIINILINDFPLKFIFDISLIIESRISFGKRYLELITERIIKNLLIHLGSPCLRYRF